MRVKIYGIMNGTIMQLPAPGMTALSRRRCGLEARNNVGRTSQIAAAQARLDSNINTHYFYYRYIMMFWS